MAESLTLCMIVKDEESSLSRCLDSVCGLCREIVIVDTGSTDATCEIALAHGASVSSYDFAVIDFAAARNYALDRATGRWVLVLDADEVLQPASAPLIRDLVNRDLNAGYYLERSNHHLNPALATVDYPLRLFPNRPNYRYRGRVHETVDASILAGDGRLVRSNIRIDHDFAVDPAARKRRNLAYIAILNEEIAEDPTDSARLDFLAAEYHQLGLFEEAAQIVRRVAAMRPLDPRAHFHSGLYDLLHQLQPERARTSFETALRLRPGYPEAQSFLDLLGQNDRRVDRGGAASGQQARGESD